MSFPRYPAYKDSGVEWLGEVPEHWEVQPLKHMVGMRSGEAITADEIEDDGEYPVFGGNGLRGYASSFTHDGSYALIGRQGALCGNVNYATGRFWASEHAVVCVPRRPLVTRWFGELLRAMNLGQYSIAAAQPGLSVDLVGRIRAPVPPHDEQVVIAAFLDRETAHIDALVAEQERLIALPREKRQAVISHAVTKGLDPNVPMKDSGIEWLGEVPAHWQRTRLKALFRQEKRQNFPDRPVLSVYRDYGVIYKDSRTDNINKTPEDISAYQLVQPGDLVVNKMKSWQGSLGISAVEGITSPDYAVFTPHHSAHSDFLHHLLRSQAMVTVYRGISNGIRLDQWRLEPGVFLALPVFLPPPTEQAAIVGRLGSLAEEYETLITEATRAISLLQERRAALITAAVTGQIDVRGTPTTEVRNGH